MSAERDLWEYAAIDARQAQSVLDRDEIKDLLAFKLQEQAVARQAASNGDENAAAWVRYYDRFFKCFD